MGARLHRSQTISPLRLTKQVFTSLPVGGADSRFIAEPLRAEGGATVGFRRPTDFIKYVCLRHHAETETGSDVSRPWADASSD